MKQRVLILCTGNIARSQMAEGFWRQLGGEAWEVFSAGTHPKTHIHPMAVRVMAERGIDVSEQYPKSVDEYVTEDFDLVVTVCAEADRACPTFHGAARRLRWPMDDPAIAGTDEEKVLAIFRRIRDQIAERIAGFLETGD